MSHPHYSSSCSCAFIGPATMNKWPRSLHCGIRYTGSPDSADLKSGASTSPWSKNHTSLTKFLYTISLFVKIFNLSNKITKLANWKAIIRAIVFGTFSFGLGVWPKSEFFRPSASAIGFGLKRHLR